MKKWSSLAAVVAAVFVFIPGSHAADWQPPGPIKLMVAFAAGGGADTQARLIAESLEQSLGWKFIPENVTGKGGINALTALKSQPADGTAIAIVVTESMAYNMLAAEGSGLQQSDFTPITTTAGFQMGIVAKTDSGFKTIKDAIDAAANAKDGKGIRFGSMSPRLADLAYLLGKANGVEFNTVMLKGGKAVMNAVNAGDVDIGWAAGIQAKAVIAGEIVNLASGLAVPLDVSPDAPLISEFGVPYDAGGYFLFAAPAGLPADARSALADAIASVVTDESSKAGGMIKKAFGGAQVINGEELDNILAKDYADAGELLKLTAE